MVFEGMSRASDHNAPVQSVGYPTRMVVITSLVVAFLAADRLSTG